MSEINKAAKAEETYKALCTAIDSRGWNCEKIDFLKVVFFVVHGDDIPMDIMIRIDEANQRVTLISKMPFKMSEDKRLEGSIATCCANFGLVDGHFDYNISDGEITFRMTSSYMECSFAEDRFSYMMDVSSNIIDEYNDKFLALNKGMLSIEDFITHESK